MFCLGCWPNMQFPLIHQGVQLLQEGGALVLVCMITLVLATTDRCLVSAGERVKGRMTSHFSFPRGAHYCVKRDIFCTSQSLFMVNLLPDNQKGRTKQWGKHSKRGRRGNRLGLLLFKKKKKSYLYWILDFEPFTDSFTEWQKKTTFGI